MRDDRRFSAREARALLWLLPVLAVAGWLVWAATATPDFSDAETGNNAEKSSSRGAADDEAIQNTGAGSPRTESADGIPAPLDDGSDENPAHRLFAFDPNTVTFHDLVRLGFERGEALGIVKYRERGKVFEIAEDFAACYQVSEAMYRRLEPYIRIGERFRLKPFESRGTGSRTSSPAANRETRATSGTGPAANPAANEDPRVVDTRPVPVDTRHTHPVRPVLTDLNTADSAALIAVSGIGPATVGRIMEHRARLGGFVNVAQLAEVRGVTEQNYQRIIEQIYVDPAAIQKIDINFVPAKTLASHPYIGAAALRKLLKERQLKGGWRSITELETDHIFTEEELAKLGPYLIFN